MLSSLVPPRRRSGRAIGGLRVDGRYRRRPAVERLEDYLLLSAFTVTNTLDSGPGSLRGAIDALNLSGVAGTIDFNIPGAGAHTISVGTTTSVALPTIQVPVTLDGFSEGVFQGTPNYTGPPLIMIEGGAVPGTNGIDLGNAPGSVIQGLSIVNFTANPVTSAGGTAIVLEIPASGVTIRGNYLGLAPDGVTAGPNGSSGIFVASSNNIIGGTTAADRNVIAASGQAGVLLSSAPFFPTTTGNLIEGNFIGTNAAGTSAVANGYGIVVAGVTQTTIGGTAAGAGNVISGNLHDGVLLTADGFGAAPAGATTGNAIQGNFIGLNSGVVAALPNGDNGIQVLDADHTTIGGLPGAGTPGNVIAGNSKAGVLLTGTGATANVIAGNQIGNLFGLTPIGNGGSGVFIQNGASLNTIGGTVPAIGNTIAFNTGNGVTVVSGGGPQVSTVGNAIQGNSIYSNSALGIDLANDGVTANDSQGHVGPNDFQNFPVLTSVTPSGSNVTITGTFDEAAEPNTTLRIEFFGDAGDPSNHGQGRFFLGATSITTDVAGHVTFTATVPAPPPGTIISSTATVTATTAPGIVVGDTSEFSANLAQTVVTTTTTLAAAPDNADFGQPITFTATVTSAGGTPTGEVAFVEGTTVLGTVPLDPTGNAVFMTSTLPAGTHSIAAIYNGGAGFQPSGSTPTSVVVNPAATTTTLTAAPNPGNAGQTITFTAVVTSAGGIPTGNVDFVEGTTVLGSAALDATGHAVFTTSTLPEGTHSVTAQYIASTDFLASASSPVSVTINPAPPAPTPTTTTITPSTTDTTFGQPITLTVIVSPEIMPTLGISAAQAEVPTGVVTIFDGLDAVGVVPLDAAGHATFTTNTSPVGRHAFTAAYAGDGTFGPSTSTAANVVVAQATSTTTLTSATNPSTFGQPTTFTVQVAGVPGVTSPSGTVVFRDGTTILGTSPLDSSGRATFTTLTLGVGTHAITAAYSGDGNYQASTSMALNQVVNPSSSAADGPRVTNLARFGFHMQPTILVLTFNEPLDPARAQNVANYTLSNGSRTHAIRAVVYDAASNSVIILPRQRLNLHRQYTLTVNGMAPNGLASAGGVLLDGANTGRPGSNYQQTFGGEILAGPASAAPGHGGVQPLRHRATRAQMVDLLLANGSLRVRRHHHR